MNCHDFENVVLSLARNRLLDEATCEQSSVHAEECERCAARLAKERALLARVRAVVEEMGVEEPPARVDAALLAAFRAQAAATVSSTLFSAPSRARHWSNWRLAAVAAGILILISMMVVFWRSAGSHKPQREEQAVEPAAPKPVEPSVSHDRIAVEQPKNEPKRARHRKTVNNPDDAEVVTEFFPLREGEDITALDSLQVVRVELPGSALGEVGLPVDPETMNEPVKADVVLGQDGLARAIRFVR
ncbi:MAG: hypothetical protein J2P21_12905 [Chloracidobacterium sp.]|nr:hypothetical protein [Chloracidobacterium sp.]